MMAFFDRMTNDSFRRSDNGTAIYLPILWLGPARSLPTLTDETAMRRVVFNFYRYAVLAVCPVFVLANLYLRLDGDLDLKDGFVIAAAIAALLLPAALLVAYFGKRFDPIDVRAVKTNALDAGDGPTLGAALFLSAFTVCIGGAALMVAFVAIADHFNF